VPENSNKEQVFLRVYAEKRVVCDKQAARGVTHIVMNAGRQFLILLQWDYVRADAAALEHESLNGVWPRRTAARGKTLML
jgi:hypothetical protein